MLLRKKENGSVLFGPAKAAEFHRVLHEDLRQEVKPRIDAINRWLREDSKRLDQYRI
jgi:hypothetical protein